MSLYFLLFSLSKLHSLKQMAQTGYTLVANCMLTFSSCLCLKATPGSMRYARAAFKLYLVSGIVGTLASLLSSVMLKDIDEVLAVDTEYIKT